MFKTFAMYCASRYVLKRKRKDVEMYYILVIMKNFGSKLLKIGAERWLRG